MEQINMSQTKVYSQKGQGFDDSATCHCRILTHVEFKLGSPNFFPVQNKGKSPPGRSRSLGSSLELTRIGYPMACKGNRFRNNKEFYQINQKQYQIFITI